MISRVPDTTVPDRGKGREPDGHRRVTDTCTFPQQRPVAFHVREHTARTGMVVAAERRTRTAHAVVEDLDLFSICRGKDPPAGALRNSGDGSVTGRSSPRFLFFNKDAS